MHTIDVFHHKYTYTQYVYIHQFYIIVTNKWMCTFCDMNSWHKHTLYVEFVIYTQDYKSRRVRWFMLQKAKLWMYGGQIVTQACNIMYNKNIAWGAQDAWLGLMSSRVDFTYSWCHVTDFLTLSSSGYLRRVIIYKYTHPMAGNLPIKTFLRDGQQSMLQCNSAYGLAVFFVEKLLAICQSGIV